MINVLLQLPVEDVLKDWLSTGQQDRAQLRVVLTWTLVVLGINIASVIWNSVLQIKLKDREKEIANYNLKQAKKIKVYETVFDKFNNLTLFLPSADTNSLLQSVQDAQSYITINKLYIDSRSISIFNKHLDYFRRMIIAPYQKDVRYEADMLEEIVGNFENV